MRKFKMTQTQYELDREEYNGLCLACGETKFGDTEPDAENYACDDCGKPFVFGIENALVMGLIEFVESDNE